MCSQNSTSRQGKFLVRDDCSNALTKVSVELHSDEGRLQILPTADSEILVNQYSYNDMKGRSIKSLLDRYYPATFGKKSFEMPVRRYIDRGLRILKTQMEVQTSRPSINELIWPIVSSPGNTDLYPFQKTGVKFLLDSGGALLVDDMGLGKSAQTIIAVRHLIFNGDITNCLIVCPKNLIMNWLREITKWAPDLARLGVSPDANNRRQVFKAAIGQCHVLVTNYEQIRVSNTPLSDVGFDLVVADEAHRLRGATSKLNSAFRKLNRQRTWLLTGTPIENRPRDFSSLLSLIRPDAFSIRSKYSHPAELRSKAQRFVLRRNKKDVLHELPEKIIRREPLEMGQEQYMSYKKAEREWRNASQDTRIAAFGNLRTICDLDTKSQTSVKCDRILEIVQNIRESAEKVVVFSHRIPPLEHLYARFEEIFPSQSIVITGKTEQSIRDKSIQRFIQEENCFAAFLSQQTASEGLTLTVASHVIFLNEWWNPSSNDQARDRLLRIGQKNVVTQWSFIIEGTIETRLQSILNEKREDFETLVEKLAVE